MQKKKQSWVLLCLIILALINQSNALSQALSCAERVCTYLTFVTKPVPVWIVRTITEPQNRTAYPYVYAELANTTNENIQTIDAQRVLQNRGTNALITETIRYTLTVPSGQTMPFFVWAYIPGPDTIGFVSLKVITWTSTSTPTYQPIPVKLIESSLDPRGGQRVTATIQNNFTQTLRNVQATVWRFDYANETMFGAVDITTIDIPGGALPPGVLYPVNVIWLEPSLMPEKVVRVSAYGVISP
jgi:hypothetical protein